jgi:23S rRNA (guanosine2251-2'-O)-methyltransferase
MTNEIWLEGAISVRAALAGGSRDVHEIILRRQQRKHRHTFSALERQAAEAGVPVSREPAEFFAAKAQGNSHGGVLARVGERRMVALRELLPAERAGFVVMLDGIEDPFNFGQAVRALYAAGLDGLVLRRRNWMSAAAVVARASAGATELVPTAVVDQVQDAANFFRRHQYQVVSTSEKAAQTIYEMDWRGSVFLLLGGEKRGITRSFLRQADQLVRIPYGREYAHALGTAVSAAVIGFELLRQRSSG